VLALITIAGGISRPGPVRWRFSFLNRYVGFLIKTSETKNTSRYCLFVPDFPGEFRVPGTSSYAYEIYYVLNGSGSQSNVV
jgi:hypothetical protein